MRHMRHIQMDIAARILGSLRMVVNAQNRLAHRLHRLHRLHRFRAYYVLSLMWAASYNGVTRERLRGEKRRSRQTSYAKQRKDIMPDTPSQPPTGEPISRPGAAHLGAQVYAL